LIQEIDSPVRTPTKETKIIQDKARELQTLLEPVLSKFYEKNKEITTNLLSPCKTTIQFHFNKEYR
jgi:hypothetical protein